MSEPTTDPISARDKAAARRRGLFQRLAANRLTFLFIILIVLQFLTWRAAERAADMAWSASALTCSEYRPCTVNLRQPNADYLAKTIADEIRTRR